LTSEHGYKVIDQITELMMDKFIDGICNGNLKVLVIEGDPSVAVLEKAWSSIYQQYLDNMGDEEQKQSAKLITEINLLESRCNLVRLVVKRLRLQHSAEVIEDLKKVVAVDVVLDPADPDTYKKGLSRILSKCRRWELDIQGKKEELALLQPDSSEEKIDAIHFDKIIIRLSRHMKFKVNKFKTAVSEFCMMFSDMCTTERLMAAEMERLKNK
jgi:hypothetical protein